MTTLKLGSKGTEVMILQKYLGLKQDGIFGPQTELKIKELQKANGLTPDGIVGPQTWNIILSNTDTGISKGMINFICTWETGKQFGYTMTAKDLNGYDLHDANGHLTYGYGLLYHPTTNKYMDTIKKRWTQVELEQLFLTHARQTSAKIDSWTKSNNIRINQNQKDAIASACYNFGYGFLNKQICRYIINNPNNPAIRTIWEHLSDKQGVKYPGLIKRRKAEAKWYFEGC